MPDLTDPKTQGHFSLGNSPDRNFICAFSNRALGNMSLFYGNTSESLFNRKKFLDPLGIDYQDLVCAKQIHSSFIRYVTETDRGKGALAYDSSLDDTDALIANVGHLPLAIFTADCLSVFLYDPVKPAIGLVHAGWRSTHENIAVKTIQLMREILNTDAASLWVGFGPCIRSCCYEVARDLDEVFSGSLIQRDKRYYLDLVQVNKKQLQDAGVKESHMADSRICTSCQNKDFFSYRKEGKSCGRQMSVMMLR